jgi:hydrophobic/amphiphilic exporter-1 (mainly G- bacteria), HAE1 family
VLATGLVVDDAIVVIENIQRHMSEERCDSHKAASEAMGEVTGAVVATSLVLVAVFVPVAFFPGTTGLLYKQFSLTIAFSIAISAFNSLTFTPSLSALLLRPETGKKNIFFRGVEHVIHRTTGLYVYSAKKALKLRYLVLVVFFCGLAATYVIYKTVPTGFVPDEDQGWFMITVQAPQGARWNTPRRPCGKSRPCSPARRTLRARSLSSASASPAAAPTKAWCSSTWQTPASASTTRTPPLPSSIAFAGR